jgi:hypothetical protein
MRLFYVALGWDDRCSFGVALRLVIQTASKDTDDFVHSAAIRKRYQKIAIGSMSDGLKRTMEGWL